MAQGPPGNVDPERVTVPSQMTALGVKYYSGFKKTRAKFFIVLIVGQKRENKYIPLREE